MLFHPRRSRFAFIVFALLLTGCETMPPQSSLPHLPRLSSEATPAAHRDAEKNKPVDAQSAMKQASQLLLAGNKDEALYYYIKAIELDSKNLEALIRIGDIHSDKGNYEQAEAAYLQALILHPGNADLLAGLGLAQLSLGKQAEARLSLTTAVAINPRLWRAYNGLGLLADRSGDYQSAEKHYLSALTIKPDTPMLLNNMGYSKYLAGDFHSALPLLNAAISIDPAYDSAWLNQGLIYARLGEEASAIQAFRHALNEADTYNNLGYIYMISGKTDAAYEYLEKAIRISPAYHQLAHENLSRLQGLR
jgi:Flp pilus assembly protein TadD